MSLRASAHTGVAIRIFRQTRLALHRKGLVYIFAFGKNYGVAAVETGGKQGSTGALHLIFRVTSSLKYQKR